MYLVKTPNFIRKIYPNNIVWDIPSANSIFLTFDDGPHPTITPIVLNMLKEYNTKATFFCVGDNVVKYPNIFTQIITDGHAIGNHTFNHLNGWFTPNKIYIENVNNATQYIQSRLFRPPYGRLKIQQAKQLHQQGFKIIMWSLLSGDFDTQLSPKQCWRNIKKNIFPGSIIVFHDSEKSFNRLQYALSCTLEFCKQQGWNCELIN